MIAYTYKEIVDIVCDYQSTKSSSVEIHPIWLYNSRISKYKLERYISDLSKSRHEKMVKLGWVSYILGNGDVINLIEYEQLIGISDKDITIDNLIDDIAENSMNVGALNLLLLKWSDGLYTPINIHDSSLPFYVDLKD